jgi:outer membrane lipase/esterase
MRKTIRFLATAAMTAALLTACGGGDPYVPGSGEPSGAPTSQGNFTAVVSFGDSLSDVGTYAPATSLTGDGQPPYLGGEFTANSPTATIWVQNVAAALGVAITPAELGFGTSVVDCPTQDNTCTAYGQGGSRVTDPNGIGHLTASGAPAALTVPVVTQIANHLARFGSFKSTDLIVIWAGNNDAFAQFGAFTATAADVQAKALAGQITADQANQLLFQAQTAAQAAMKQAAEELVGYIKTQILAKGGQYVAVLTLPDSTLTPLGASLLADPASAAAVPVLSGLVDTFNLWLRDGLTGMPVEIIDQNGPGKDIYAHPGNYGLTNVTTPVCDPVKIAAVTGGQVTDGSSLFCNATPGAPYNTIVDGADLSTWQFADSVHPTPAGHALISAAVLQQLHAFGWI